MAPLGDCNVDDILVQGALEDGLQKAMRSDLYGDGIVWDVLAGVLK